MSCRFCQIASVMECCDAINTHELSPLDCYNARKLKIYYLLLFNSIMLFYYINRSNLILK